DGETGLPRLLSLPLPGPFRAVLLLVFLNRGLPLGQIFVRDQMLVLLGDEESPCLLIGVDDGRVDPGFLHRLDGLEFDLLDRRQVEEDGIVWARFPTVFVDELLPLLLQNVGHLVAHRDRLVDRAGLILLPLEPLVVAAVLVLPAAAARAGCVPRELFP